MSTSNFYLKFAEKSMIKHLLIFYHCETKIAVFWGLGGGGYVSEICLSETKYEQMLFRT